jgi:purine-binding chemotaxis protein CheW
MSSHSSLELAGAEAQLGRQLGDQIIVADIGGVSYGVPVDDLLEVEYVPNVAPVPHTEDWLHGVVNLRGSILTLMDPARLLEVGTWTRTPQARMLVVGRDDPVALAIGQLRGMRHFTEPVSPELVEHMPGRVADYVKTVYRDGANFLIVLNIQRLLDDADHFSRRQNETRSVVGDPSPGGHVPAMERGDS